MTDAAARSAALAREAITAHRRHRGKIETRAKVPVRGPEDLALWYTPGVAAASRAIAEDPGAVDDLTWRADVVAVMMGQEEVGEVRAVPGGHCLTWHGDRRLSRTRAALLVVALALPR